MNNQRRWARNSVEVPCTVSYQNDTQNPTPARIVNLSPGGIMLAAEQGFIPNQKVAIALNEEQDSLLFEFVDMLTGTVRWSQACPESKHKTYHVGIAFDGELPRRIILTEQ